MTVDKLSLQQRRCLALVAAGRTSKQIARALELSPSTVDNHIRSAMERLGVTSRGEAAKMLGPQALGGTVAASAAPLSPVDGGGMPVGPPATSLHAMLVPPPLGGWQNRLSMRRRFYHVVQIALLGTMAFAAIVITIAGIVHLFNF